MQLFKKFIQHKNLVQGKSTKITPTKKEIKLFLFFTFERQAMCSYLQMSFSITHVIRNIICTYIHIYTYIRILNAGTTYTLNIRLSINSNLA